MMLGWVQNWALAYQSINIHQYKIHHIETQVPPTKQKIILLLFRTSAHAQEAVEQRVKFFLDAFFVTTFIHLFIINVS